MIYGICITFAFIGPNAHLFANIGNNYWSEVIETLGPTYNTMLMLFGIDILSVLLNAFCLWKVINVNMLLEFCRGLRDYGHFMAILLAFNMNMYFAATDINLGMDGTQSFQWISDIH